MLSIRMTDQGLAPQESAPASSKRGPRKDKKTAARCAAIQAIFEIDFQAGTDWRKTSDEYCAGRLDLPLGKNGSIGPASKNVFQTVLRSAFENRARIDHVIQRRLPESWPIHRIDPVLLAVFRAAGGELIAAPELPAAIIVSEYVLIASLFGGNERELGFVNGMIDGMALEFRPENAERES